LSGRGLCDELITRPEESYRLCCVVVCDLETPRIGAPYIYDIRSLRVIKVLHMCCEKQLILHACRALSALQVAGCSGLAAVWKFLYLCGSLRNAAVHKSKAICR